MSYLTRLLFALSLLLPLQAVAKPHAQLWPPLKWQGALPEITLASTPQPHWLDSYHQRLSEALIDTSTAIDSYLSQTPTHERSRSRLQLTSGLRWREAGQLLPYHEIDAHIDFPRLKRKLYIEFNRQEGKPDNNHNHNHNHNHNNTPNNNLTLGLGTIRELGERLNWRLRSGVQLEQFKLDPFIYGRIEWQRQLSPWRLTLRSELRHSHLDGNLWQQQLQWRRPLAPRTKFSSLSYHQRDLQQEKILLGQRLLLSHQLNSPNYLTLLLSLESANWIDYRLNECYLQLGYHHPFRRRWLRLEVLPRLERQRSDGFHTRASIAIQMVATLGSGMR
ncbi:hypothetical protein D5085_18720 [Ectothiorhodospiraceae bacterium BW-2]|nr:hypothetical protein D5085_18720 [Ectothiorhodospiraceae bacterium BW-2]